MSEHTPGPWEIAWSNDSLVNGPDGNKVAGAGGPRYAKTVRANARLIAAAPDLLAALEDLRSRVMRVPPEFLWDRVGPLALERVDAAIAKARGAKPAEADPNG